MMKRHQKFSRFIRAYFAVARHVRIRTGESLNAEKDLKCNLQYVAVRTTHCFY